MSAFGQAGFGSKNRQNQLRAQGQMDPYGQQVRAAKQAPTFNIYQTQQPAQQPASQQAKPPATPAAPAMPAYSTGQTAQPTATPGTAQPIQPQSQGTPYGADPGYADRVAAAAQQWNSTPAGSQQFGNWQNNPSAVARQRQQEMAARNAEMAAAGLASDQLTQQANNTERLYVQDGFAQRQFERDGQNVTELAPSYGIGGLGTEHLPRYRRLPDGTMQRVDQADRAPVGGPGAPGQAQPIPPQAQGTPYHWAAPGVAVGPSSPQTQGTPERFVPQTPGTEALKAMEKEQLYQDRVNAVRGRINAANAGLLGRYIGDGAYEYDYMLKGYGGDVDPATLSFSLVGSPKRT